MRGSPLIRTVLVLLALVVSGIGFARLTDRGTEVPDPIVIVTDPAGIRAKVRISFSEVPGEVSLRSGGKDGIVKADSLTDYSGGLLVTDSVLYLKATKKNVQTEDAGNFFAKLTVEAEGKKTFTHVFDAPGDIDDFVELPF